MEYIPDLLQNIVNILVFIVIANRVCLHTRHWKSPQRQAIIGVLFGIAGFISMHIPVQAGDSVSVDFTIVLAGMAGLLGGPLSAAVAAAVISAYMLYQGGVDIRPDMFSVMAAACIGALFSVQTTQLSQRSGWWRPVTFGLLVAAAQLAFTAVFLPDMRSAMLKPLIIPLLLSYPAVSLLFYYFLTWERDRVRDAMFDHVTQLATSDYLIRSWRKMTKRKQPYALVILHVEQLQSIQDLYGIEAANELLRQCASRLAGNLPNGATPCRYRERDFAVTLPGYDMLQALIWLVDAKKLLSAPYLVSDVVCRISFSSGLAVYEADETTIEDICRQADTALRYAMENGPDQTVPYEAKLTEQLRYRTSLEKDLGFALEREQFQLHYQPQYELQTGRLRGFEALLRWNHPQWGMISPSEFIPLAEQTGLIVPIGEWVLQTACRMAMKMNMNESDITMAVNVSAVQLRCADFADRVLNILQETELRGDCLEIEITESSLIQSFEQASAQLERLKRQGVRLALDDFGVGYSSLNYLRRMPFDLIKIDRSFIEDIGKNKDDQVIKSIFAWVKQLRYNVVAEGLESSDQLYWLKQWKCDFAQGYLFSRPIPEQDISLPLLERIPSLQYGTSMKPKR